MKLLYSMLLTLCLVSPSWADGMIIRASCFSCSSSPLICQNYEGLGYDNSESWTESLGTGGVVDEDDTTATVLRGSQQLKVLFGTSGSVYSRISFASQSDVWVFFRFKFTGTVGSSTTIIKFTTTSGGGAQFYVGMDTTRHPRIAHGSTIATSTAQMTADTIYYVWAHYIVGTGTNGQAELYWGTTPVRPTVDVSITTGTATGNVAWVDIVDDNNSHANFYDQVMINSSTIGNVCD